MSITLSRIINHGFELQVKEFYFIRKGDIVLTNGRPNPDFDVSMTYPYIEVSLDVAASMIKNLIINKGFRGSN